MRAARRSLPLALAVLAAACATTSPPPAPNRPARGTHAPTVDALVAPLLADHWFGAMAIALVTPDGVELSLHGQDAGAPLRRDALFEIGSITKVFGALLLATAVDAGELSLDTPVADLLPAAAPLADAPGPVTLEHLATHTSGLPRLPADFAPADAQDPYADFDDAALARALASTPRTTAPGARYAYSNLGAGLLGRALAERLGAPWDVLLRARVTAPLGLEDVYASLPPELEARRVTGHTADGFPTPPWRFTTLAAAGALYATLDDLVRFVQLNLTPDRSPLAGALRLAQAPRRDAEAGRIGLGWHVTDSGTVWHNGGTGGFHSYVAFRPREGVGVVVLANAANPLADALGVTLLGMLRGRPAPPLATTPLATLSAASLERCAGTYLLDDGTPLRVEVDGAWLRARFAESAPLRLFPETATRFHFRALPGTVTFEVPSEGGPASAAVLESGGEVARAVRIPAGAGTPDGARP